MTLDDIVRVHNQRRKESRMGKMVFVVLDEQNYIYGIYEEMVDAQERASELEDTTTANAFMVLEFLLNHDEEVDVID